MSKRTQTRHLDSLLGWLNHIETSGRFFGIPHGKDINSGDTKVGWYKQYSASNLPSQILCLRRTDNNFQYSFPCRPNLEVHSPWQGLRLSSHHKWTVYPAHLYPRKSACSIRPQHWTSQAMEDHKNSHLEVDFRKFTVQYAGFLTARTSMSLVAHELHYKWFWNFCAVILLNICDFQHYWIQIKYLVYNLARPIVYYQFCFKSENAPNACSRTTNVLQEFWIFIILI